MGFPHLPVLWLFVLYATLVGKWAQVHPARFQIELFTRGLALVAGAYALHVSTYPQTGGGAGSFFFWSGITTLYYAFMLKPIWATSLVGAAVFEYVASSVGAGDSVPWGQAVAQGGFLVIYPLLVAARFGAAMRAPDETRECSLIDRSTGLYNWHGLLEHGEELLACCRRDRAIACLVLLDCDELPEARPGHDHHASRKRRACIAKTLLDLSISGGLAARIRQQEFALVLPGVARSKAIHAIERALASSVPSGPGDVAGDVAAIPRLAAVTLGPGNASFADSYDELSRELAVSGRRCGTGAPAEGPAQRI